MEQDDAQTIEQMLAENDVDAERALQVLIATLVRDHLRQRAAHRTKALNEPTTLWHLEKALWEQRSAAEAEAKAEDDDRTPDWQVQGMLSVLLVTCRERAEDQAPDPTADVKPIMRIVRD